MYQYQNCQINIVEYGIKKKETIVFLHGWGQNIEMMEPLAKPFQNDYHVIIFDLPGFGKSEEPPHAWTLQEYVEMIHAYLEEKKIEKPNLVGHSFGGKISLLYASMYPTKNLVLLASPYKVRRKKPSLSVRILKQTKKLPGLKKVSEYLKSKMGSTDYKNATPIMRDVLVKHVNTDLTQDAKKITCPTIMIWGTDDQAVPLSDAYELEKIIQNSAVIVYEKKTHYAYLENLNQTVRIIKSLISKE